MDLIPRSEDITYAELNERFECFVSFRFVS
jgi:hypothetical protein